MRERLFRGKRKDNGEWVYGYYVLVNDIKQIFVPFSGEDKEFFKNTEYEKTGGRYINVIPETVGEFTGLTDNDGIKIFEGDVVEYKNKYGTVVFRDGAYIVKLDTLDVFLSFIVHHAKVIGNIHDNPELNI